MFVITKLLKSIYITNTFYIFVSIYLIYGTIKNKDK